jgi:hypothetical protein
MYRRLLVFYAALPDGARWVFSDVAQVARVGMNFRFGR